MLKLINPTIGTITELKITTKLIELGYRVFKPITTTDTIDCVVVDNNGNCNKVQIKTCRIGKNNFSFKTIGTKPYTNKNKKVEYTYYNDVDYFATLYKDSIYLVPINDVNKQKTCFTINKNDKTYLLN
jgi:hypothetical protein